MPRIFRLVSQQQKIEGPTELLAWITIRGTVWPLTDQMKGSLEGDVPFYFIRKEVLSCSSGATLREKYISGVFVRQLNLLGT